MKYLFATVLIFIVVSCGPKIIAFEYTSASYSGSYSIKAEKDSVKFDRQGKKGRQKQAAFNKEDWEKLVEMALAIDLTKIDTLPSPSNDRAVNNVSTAYLLFHFKDTIYTSAEFDDFAPNELLKPFMDSLIFKTTPLLR